jgi:hypothetical protein
MVGGLSSAVASPLSRLAPEPRDPPTRKSKDELLAEWRAANRANLTPQEAFRSGAELGPANTTNSLASNHVSKVHTEIKVDGKVIARVYNGGAVEIANEYTFLADELGFQNDTMVGPDLAEDRAKRIKGILEKYGAVMKDDLSPDGLLTAQLAKTPVLELLRAQTAQTQEEWQEEMAKQGPLDPGAFFSRVA